MRASSWLLAFVLLATPAVGGVDSGRLAVLGPDGRLTVLRGDQAQTLLPPHPKAAFTAWSPAGDRLAVVEEATLGTRRPFRLILLEYGKEHAKPRQLQPASEDLLLWREIVGLSWPQAGLITVEGRIDPDTVVTAEIDPRSGAVTATRPGKWFSWSPNGTRLAAIGWVPHFAPAPKEGDRVEIGGEVAYQGPQGSVIRPPLLWSPDGERLAFVEEHAGGRDLLVVSHGAPPRRFALTAESPGLLAWSDDGSALLVRDGSAQIRVDSSTGTAERLAAADLSARGFGRFSAAAASAARAVQMQARASAWWQPPNAAEPAKGKTP